MLMSSKPMIYSSSMLALALMKLRRSGVPSQSRCWSVVAKSCWRQWGRSDSQRELANVRWWCHRLIQLRSTLRVISVLTDNPYSQAMLWMLSDGRQFVRLILFQSSTPDTILCRWKTIDGYRPGHYSVNNSARWCQLSRWIAHSYSVFFQESALVVIISATISSDRANLRKFL